MENLKRIKDNYENKIIINKSIFICSLYRVDSVEEVDEILAKTNKKYYDATHNCYAYIIGDNQEIQKCYDDGEPQKTAGSPMLEVLKKNDMTNILAVTTRYFGGILLGAGGLIRAYSSSVKETLKLAKLYVLEYNLHIKFTTSYQGYNSILKVIPYLTILNTAFGLEVIIDGAIPSEMFDKLKEDLYRYKIDPTSLTKLEMMPIETLVTE